MKTKTFPKFTTAIIFFLAFSPLLLSVVTESDIHSLQFMREEEKLARDVYLKLYDEYGITQFANIAKSEQKHTDSVYNLMNLFGVQDTALEAPGLFADPLLQDMYDALIDWGMQSRVAAYNVAITIEVVDIADLDHAIEATENPDMIRVFNNLRNGSFKHLAAFSSGLANETGFSGATYEDGMFSTWMGLISLQTFPWVYLDGGWAYLEVQPNGDIYLSTPGDGGSWYWTTEAVFPWCYDLNSQFWVWGTSGN